MGITCATIGTAPTMNLLSRLRDRLTPDLWAWVMIVASLPLVAYCLPRLSSGFDFWQALEIQRGMQYGDSVMHAYPLPMYVPFAPIGALPDSWIHWLAPAICLAFLAVGLWLWGARRPPIIAAALMSPVGLGLLVNSNFPTAVAIFGFGLAAWAKRTGHLPLVGLGVALGLWRPLNCLPVIVVFLASGWRPSGLLRAVGALALFMAPLTALAFLIQPDWVARYQLQLIRLAGSAGIGPHVVSSVGPVGYAAALVAVALAGIWVLRRRGLEAGAAFALALSIFLATDAGAYSGAVALPALVLAAEEARYAALPAAASLVGWAQAAVLLAIDFPVGVIAYWFALQAYPLLRPTYPKVSPTRASPTEPALSIRSAASPK
jgi:hypothetical protein